MLNSSSCAGGHVDGDGFQVVCTKHMRSERVSAVGVIGLDTCPDVQAVEVEVHDAYITGCISACAKGISCDVPAEAPIQTACIAPCHRADGDVHHQVGIDVHAGLTGHLGKISI